ncbi:hypothetical protein BDM02DRAFT_217557 [Thelephora ganbajun]|uniref:Uncharacterized protein n=1 Tax=Thelephora ganbajun TaxID=370292 RepID=A0ACB6ZRM3_THEGA|nr:hypothetical protein BDM02DRAFT_217557 [Thelephora ganbajun]
MCCACCVYKELSEAKIRVESWFSQGAVRASKLGRSGSRLRTPRSVGPSTSTSTFKRSNLSNLEVETEAEFESQAQASTLLILSQTLRYLVLPSERSRMGIIGIGIDIIHVPRVVSSEPPNPREIRRSDTQSERVQRMGNAISSDHVRSHRDSQGLRCDRHGGKDPDLGAGQVPRRSVGNQRGRIQSALSELQTNLEGTLGVQGIEQWCKAEVEVWKVRECTVACFGQSRWRVYRRECIGPRLGYVGTHICSSSRARLCHVRCYLDLAGHVQPCPASTKRRRGSNDAMGFG